MSTKQQKHRLEARISPEQKALFKRAAELEGLTLTDFYISAVQERAHRTIERTSIVMLAMEDQVQFARALAEPPAATPALERAISHRNLLLGDA